MDLWNIQKDDSVVHFSRCALPFLEVLGSWGGLVAGRPHLSVDRGQGDGVVTVVYTGGRKKKKRKEEK